MIHLETKLGTKTVNFTEKMVRQLNLQMEPGEYCSDGTEHYTGKLFPLDLLLSGEQKMFSSYFKTTTTVGNLVSKLYELVETLSLMEEDEILSANITISDTENCIEDILWDRNLELDEDYEKLKEHLQTIEPRILYDYFFQSENEALSVSYFEGLDAAKLKYWRENLEPQTKID